MKKYKNPTLCALLVILMVLAFGSSCGEQPMAPDPDERQHFVNYNTSYGAGILGGSIIPPSEAEHFQKYPHIGRAFESAQAFFDSTMGDNEPITIFVALGEVFGSWGYLRCAGDGSGIVACAQKGRRRIIITGRDPFDLVHGSFEWWRRVIIHETFHDLGMVGHWDPPRGTIMDTSPKTDDIHPELWDIMRQEGWNVNSE